jgi:RHS repeat-associated protein
VKLARARQNADRMYYLRARYYEPTIGSFLTQDPFPGFVVAPQSLNRCVYAGNNPTNWVDPSGLVREGGRCNIAQALLGSSLVYTGLLLEVPGIYLAIQPGTQLGGLLLLELGLIPMAAGMLVILESECVT